jgi:hypothetical protein
MRDPFSAPVDFNNENHRAGNELTRTNMPLSVGDYGLQNGDATTFAVNTDTLVRHQLQGASLQNDLTAEDSITRLMDPETKVTLQELHWQLVLSVCTPLSSFQDPLLFCCRGYTSDHGHKRKRSYCFASKLQMLL